MLNKSHSLLMISICAFLSLGGRHLAATLIRWQPVPKAAAYRVVVESARERTVLKRTVKSSSVEVKLEPGEYRLRILVLNKLGRVAVRGDWQELVIKKALIPVVERVSPRRVVRHGTVNLTVRGKNFRQACRVRLRRDDHIIVPDKVTVHAATRLSVTFTATKLALGQYTLQVANPSGKTARLTEALRVVPHWVMPVFHKLSRRTVLTSEKTARLTLTGERLRPQCRVYLRLGEERRAMSRVNVESSKRLLFTVPAASLGPGRYDLELVNPGEKRRRVKNALTIQRPVKPPQFSKLSPARFTADRETARPTLTGDELREGCQVILRRGERTVTATDVKVENRTTLRFTFSPETLGPGKYDLVLINPGNKLRAIEAAVTVIQPYVAPVAGTMSARCFWAGAKARRVTISGKHFREGIRCRIGKDGKWTEVKVMPPVSSNQLEVNLPLDRLAAGIYDLRLINQGNKTGERKKAFRLCSRLRPQAGQGDRADMISVSWREPADEVSYHVFRSNRADGEFRRIAAVGAPPYRDRDVKFKKTYFYKIRAVFERFKTTPMSQAVKGFTAMEPVTLTAKSFLGNIRLDWSQTKQADRYVVYRAPGKGADFRQLTITQSYRYHDWEAKPKQNYYYKVCPLLKGETGPRSQPASAMMATPRWPLWLWGVLPGAGQIYIGQWLKGGIFAGGFLLSGGGLAFSVYYQEQQYRAYEAMDRSASAKEFVSAWHHYEMSTYLMWGLVGFTSAVYTAQWLDILFFTKPVEGYDRKTYAGLVGRSFLPGWGQWYLGRPIKAALFGAGFLLSGGGLVYALLEQNGRYHIYKSLLDDASPEEYNASWQAYEQATYVVWGAAGLTGAVYLLNWLDILLFNGQVASETGYLTTGGPTADLPRCRLALTPSWGLHGSPGAVCYLQWRY